MENITFKLSGMHRHGTAFFEYLGLRKKFFVDNLGWDIPHDDSVEMDQYDNPTACYSLVLRDGEVVGGARVMPTTAKWGSHTYMLRDAVQGKLIDIPCLSLIVDGLIDMVTDHGASKMMCLSTLSLVRALRQLGYDAERIGEPYLNEGDGRKYAVLAMPAARGGAFVPKATHRPSPQPLHAPSKV